MNTITACLGGPLLALSLGNSTQADVLRVAGATPDYDSIAAAVAAAADGDTLLVYTTGLVQAPVLIDGKALTLVADEPARIVLTSGVEVRNLNLGQTVVFEGFAVGGFSGLNVEGPAFSVRFCQGAVRIDDCSLQGRTPGHCELHYDGYQGLYVTQSGDVAVSGCELIGGMGKSSDEFIDCGGMGHSPGNGGPGAFVRNSNAALLDTQLTGGVGGYSDDGSGMMGGPGLDARESYVFLAGSTVSGGDGSDGGVFFSPFGCGGGGGSGLAASTNSTAEFFGSTFQGGAGGAGTDSLTGQPCPGFTGSAAWLLGGSSHVDLNATARTMTIAAPIRVGQPTPLHFEGQPGDRVFAMLSAQPAFLLPFPQAAGAKLVGALIRRLPLGTIDTTGQLDVQLATPPLPPGSESLTWYWQGLFVSTDGQAVVGPTEPWIIVDSGF